VSFIGYVDAGYLSDPLNDKSQTCFMFLLGGTAISWKSYKHTLIGTSTNHSEIITIYEAARECAWLHRVILYDPLNDKSQTCFMFLHGGTAISWKSYKHTLIGTSTNHSEIITLYEAARECGIEPIESLTIIYEDNAVCITQMLSGYVKSNITKHITPKLFYQHELQINGEIRIQQIKSCNNLVDLFTKFLPYATFSKCVVGIGIRRLRDLHDLGRALS
jgi:hypothetical protein